MFGKRSARRAAIVTGVTLVPLAVFGSVGFAKSDPSASQYQYGKVTICHHTHSKKHPYVKITISLQGWLHGHSHHAGDILLTSPTASCPTVAATTTTTTTKTHGNSGNHGNGGNHGNNGGEAGTNGDHGNNGNNGNNGHHGKP